MKQTIGLSQFRDAFFCCNRGEQFTYEALELIFNHLEEYENDCGVELELDPVAVCCEYGEETPLDIASYYNIEIDADSPESTLQTVREWLEEATEVVGVTATGCIVYRQC
jgi:hypothetical protein